MNNLKRKLSVKRSSVLRTGLRSPNIFDFNHISKDLSEDIEKTLKDFYKFYHKNGGVTTKLSRVIKENIFPWLFFQQEQSFLEQQQVELLWIQLFLEFWLLFVLFQKFYQISKNMIRK